jgi:hypothetical protein
MQSAHFALLCAAALATASACGGEDDRPAATLDGSSGSSSSGGKSSRAGSSSQDSEAGTEASAGDGAQAGGGGGEQGGAGGIGIDYETAGAPAQLPGLCDPAMKLGDEAPQEVVSLPAGAMLLAVTPDERSVVFVVGDESEQGLYVGDRATLDDAFAAQEVPLPPGYEAASGATLSSDALTLVLVSLDHSGFGALTRAERGEAFSNDVDTAAFSRINAQKAMSGRELGWPVLSSDGGSLYFLSYFGEGLIVQSTRGADGRFDLGTELDPFTLGGGVGAYKRINAVSRDERAIFLFDEATERASALFRSRPNSPFFDPVDLGDRRGVAPNADCTRLYSSVDGELVSQDLE